MKRWFSIYFCSLIRLLSKFNGTGICPSRCFTLLEGIGTVNFDEEEDFNIGSVEALIVAVQHLILDSASVALEMFQMSAQELCHI